MRSTTSATLGHGPAGTATVAFGSISPTTPQCPRSPFGTDVRCLRPPLVELLRRQRTRSGIVCFRAGEAPGDLTESDRRLLTELLDLGLFSAMRLDQGNQVSVSPPISNDAEGDDGFGAQLRAAMAANVDKLREARRPSLATSG